MGPRRGDAIGQRLEVPPQPSGSPVRSSSRRRASALRRSGSTNGHRDRGQPSPTSFPRRAMDTISARLPAPSLPLMLATWTEAVFLLMTRTSAISPSVRPSATNASTSCSRGVRSCRPRWALCPRRPRAVHRAHTRSPRRPTSPHPPAVLGRPRRPEGVRLPRGPCGLPASRARPCHPTLPTPDPRQPRAAGLGPVDRASTHRLRSRGGRSAPCPRCPRSR